jgi:hypothetical protein
VTLLRLCHLVISQLWILKHKERKKESCDILACVKFIKVELFILIVIGEGKCDWQVMSTCCLAKWCLVLSLGAGLPSRHSSSLSAAPSSCHLIPLAEQLQHFSCRLVSRDHRTAWPHPYSGNVLLMWTLEELGVMQYRNLEWLSHFTKVLMNVSDLALGQTMWK